MKAVCGGRKKLYSKSQRIKEWLVSLGPDNPLVKLALTLHGRLHHYRITFLPNGIKIAKNPRAILVRHEHYLLVPMIEQEFDHYFHTIASKPGGEEMLLDFSKPGAHRYLPSGLELVCPGIPEDESMDAYLHQFKLREGMTVFDVGANAGLTACFLSREVGPEGKVYAFEPDDINRHYLLENVRRLGLENVTVLDWAIGARNGKVLFHMDGTTTAGLADLALYPGTGSLKEVQMFTLEECCARLGCAPDFIKMDIEGAETGVVRAALEFLKRTPIRFSIESNHPMKDGALTCHELDKLFLSIGYRVESSDKYGQVFTWAAPGVLD